MKIRKAFPLASLLVLSGVLAACGPTNPSSSTVGSETVSSSENLEVDSWETPDDYVPFEGDPKDLTANITVWHTYGASSSPTVRWLSGQVEAFQAFFPNINVTLENHSNYDQIWEDLRNAISANNAPTMAVAYPDHVADYLDAGVSVNLAGYINDPIIGMGCDDSTNAGPLDDYYGGYLEECVSYDTPGVYSMPWSKSTEVMFYNKDVFDLNGWGVPTTWEDLWKLCGEIIAVSGTGNEEFYPFGYDSDDNLYITLSEQMGIPYTTAEGDNHYLFNNDQAKAMVSDLLAQYQKHYFVTKGSLGGNQFTSSKFQEGNLYMTVGSTGGAKYNFTTDFNIGIAALPQYDPENPKVISQGPSMTFFATSSREEIQAAWLFYKWCTNSDNTCQLSRYTGYNPVRKSAFETESYKDWLSEAVSGSEAGLIREAIEFANDNYADAYFTSPVFHGSAAARTAVGGIITNVLLGSLTVDQAFETALNDVTTAS